ncbi:hypothetical protein SteCoe_14029 [Stentor coeruleus]|uniref:Uncharacterized protein n=1 Tax=Stentor coeruleus TaxID=5963 RepID=A0A1R2C6Z1_9CILI|nr:hypothetical protein SteCoe_14029 [Stentor coeruleus]
MQSENTERNIPRQCKYKIRVISEEETELETIIPIFSPKIDTDYVLVEDSIQNPVNEEPTVPIEKPAKTILKALEILKNRTEDLQIILNNQTKALIKLNKQELTIERIERKLLVLEDMNSRKNSNCNFLCMGKCFIV